MKFTFKRHEKKGKYRSFQEDNTDIKLNKKVVGTIHELSHLSKERGKYKVLFAVKKEKTKKSPAPFKWARVKQLFPDEESAREWIQNNSEKIQKQLDLYFFED